ncbi:hypothetical protein BD779DRAFT_1795495 [Infundibulicybe gibba]|nr:hypothetical protein BD779DRAFT_1795495 [Infundibulicybe gibba]
MTANRPRNSILNLFDPLSLDSPDRNAPSPDSDKENTTPSLNFCSQPHKPPAVLKRRLVDVGDITMDEVSMHMPLIDEEEPEDGFNEDSENDTITLHHIAASPIRSLLDATEPFSPSSSKLGPRTPFAELTLDYDATPRPKAHHRPVHASPCSSPERIRPNTTLSASPLASVINAVNSSGVSFAGACSASLPHNPEETTSGDVQEPQEIPKIAISAPDALAESFVALTIDGTAHLDSPSDNIPGPSQTYTRLRPNPPNTSSRDSNRSSVDLQSSFYIHLQSSDASFDLLNDKISFFSSVNGTDSFMNTLDEDDESFDMEREVANMESALQRLREEGHTLGRDKEDEHAHSRSHETDPKTTMASSEPKSIHPLSTPHSTPSNHADTPDIQIFNKHTNINNSRFSQPQAPKRQSLTPSRVPSSPQITPVFAPPLIETKPTRNPTPPSSLDEHAPVMPPPLVSALRIVKRPKTAAQAKSGTSGSSPISLDPPPVPSVSNPISQQVYRPTSTPKPDGRPPAIDIKPHRLAPSQPFQQITSGSGPRRVLIADDHTNRDAPPKARFGMMGAHRGATAGESRPRQATTSHSPPLPMKAIPRPVISGLKPPSSYKTTGSTASALPRPLAKPTTTRLPAPGLTRSRPGVGGTEPSGARPGISVRRPTYGQ